MKTLRNLIAVACAAVLALAGCQEEIFNEPIQSGNYHASVESFTADTKTALGQGRSVVWSSGDQIAIFEGTSAGKAYKVVNASVGKSKGEFTLVKNLCTDATADIANNTIAVYPFNKNLTVESASNGFFYSNAFNIKGVTFPSRQTYTPGSFSDEAFPMVAVTQKGSSSLAFMNIGGVIKLSLTGSCAVSEITIEGHNNEYLSGPVEFSLTPPDAQFNKNASIYVIPKRTAQSVTLVCDPAVQLDSEKATDFFICIPPTEFKSGFTATITDSEGNKSTKSTNKANEVRRSTILAMPEVDNDRDKEIQKYESPYGYDVTKFVKGIGKDIEFPEDVQIIMDWLKDQEFVESVECDEYYKVIHIKFKDSTDFYIVNEQRECILQLSPAVVHGPIIIVGQTYNIESHPDEVIQDNTRMLYIQADTEIPIPYDDGIYPEYTPADIEIVTTNGFNYLEEDLSSYGSILIAHTHGVPQGHFCISDSCIPDGKAIRGIIRDVDEKTFRPTYLTDNTDIYSRIGNNNPFIFAHYCWSAEGTEDYVSAGSFVGYDILSNTKKNAGVSKGYSYFTELFKGLTHIEAFNELPAIDFPAWTVPETGDARDWTPYVHTTPQQYGEPNMRYYSITTEEPDTKDGKAIIKGKINGYKNLRDDVQYKVFIYDGTRSTMPQFPETAIDLTVADDGTIHQDISEYLEPDIEYSFNIGIEYYDNYYIGDSKKIMKEATQEYIQQFESPYGYEVSKYVKSLEYPDDVLLIKYWLEDQEFVESVELHETFEAIYIRFIDGNDFYITTVNDSGNYDEMAETTANNLLSNSNSIIYDVRSIESETIQENNRFLYVRGDPYGWFLWEDKIESIDSPLDIVFTAVNGEEYFEEDLSDYGTILISHVHGGPRYGCFAIRDEHKNFCGKKINGLIIERQVDHDLFVLYESYFTALKDVYNRIGNNHPFVFANYCWSFLGKNAVSSGSFVGYSVKTASIMNPFISRSYFRTTFNGLTHKAAMTELEKEVYEYDPEGSGNTYEVRAESAGEPNQRYFSIATEEPETEDGKAIIKGQIKGYKNLKPQVKDNIKVYLYDGVEAGNPQNATITVDLNVAYDGTIDQNISGNLKPNIEYTFQIGFEYNGNYYIGESKKIKIEMDKWVDLGLPSGTLWAAWNVGANSPEEYGGYYAWGETGEKSSYSLENYKHYLGEWYNCDQIGDIWGTSYDVAHVKWGDGARMPTLDEVKELINYSTFNYDTYNGVKGCYVIGPNRNYIFLPFAGYQGEKNLYYEGEQGLFWSGKDAGRYLSCYFNCKEEGVTHNLYPRFDGLSVRPVKTK